MTKGLNMQIKVNELGNVQKHIRNHPDQPQGYYLLRVVKSSVTALCGSFHSEENGSYWCYLLRVRKQNDVNLESC